MSPNTFIKWFFSWIAAFKLDFRKEIDPWCQYRPQMLACDGTHIGVSVRNMKLDPAVTPPDDKNTVLKSVHTRKKRLILPDKTQRKHMPYIVKKCLKKLKPNDTLHRDLEEEKTTDLINYVYRNCSIPFYELLVVFSQNLQHIDVLPSYSKNITHAIR